MPRSCRAGGSPAVVTSRNGKRAACPTILLVLLAFCSTTFASSTVTTSSLDGGGLHASSANYAIDSSVGGIGGTSSGGNISTMPGSVGQLTEIVSISVTSTPDIVNEDATSQFSATATFDDNSVSVLAGSDVTWASASYPLASIDSNGLATASSVYATTNGVFSGFYLGSSSTGLVAVIDSNPDNFGSYAGDGIPDSWQVQYFGTNNPNAAPGIDADGTGQNNLFKYTAGLDPTNPASVFVLQIASVSGQPTQKNLIFNPEVSGRTYTPQFRTNLVSGAWANLSGLSGPVTNVNQVTVTDLGATQTQKFYRIDISLP